MSSYRDDTHEIVRAAGATWVGALHVTEEVARCRAVVLSVVLSMMADVAVAQDAVIDRVQLQTTELGVASNEVLDLARARNLIAERAKAVDLIPARTRVLMTEEARASDEVLDKARSAIAEHARVLDTPLGQRRVQLQVTDTARATDRVLNVQRTTVQEQATGGAVVLGKALTKYMASELASARDEIEDSSASTAQLVTEHAKVLDQWSDHLNAVQLVSDHPAVGFDEVLQQGAGQAWTASTEGWGMSRFEPFTFDGLAVIDGKLYATSAQGVHQLGGRDEQMTATVKTGAIDMTGGVLTHMTESRLAYELDGTAHLTVTQGLYSAAPQSYTYAMPVVPAAGLTNGRFVLGRGLRARHYAFALTLNGKHAYINDWSFVLAPSTRSI